MKKILLGLFLVFSFFSFFSFSPIASATGFEDVDWTVPMTSTAQARLRIGVANFSKVWAYKATMTNGEVTGLSLVCQYASSSNGVNPIVKECTTFINNDNTNLVLVAFSNNANAGVIADLLPGSGGVFSLSDDVFYPRIISASVLANGAVPTTAQLIPEINYGFPVLPQDPIAQNGDPGWNYLPLGPDSAWIGAGLPVPTEPGHYIVKLVKNAGAGGSSGVPTLDFKANGQTSVTLTSAPSATNPVNLTWTATGVSSCTATTTATPAAPAVWTGTKTTSGTFALTNLAASTNYVLKTDCSDSMGNHVIKTVSITTAPPASTVTLTSSDSDNSVLSTETFTLSWSSTGTPAGDSCSRSSTPAVTAWTLATAPDAGGPITIGPLAVGSYVFKVECNNPSGVLPAKASTTLTINVTAPVASVIFTNPSVTVPAPGGNATLTWTPTNAGSCVISPTSTPAGPTGTITGNSWTGTFPTAGTFTYKVTCTATGGALPANPEATATVTVTAPPPAPSLSFTPPIPTSVQAGGSLTLAWTSSGMAANSCNRTGGFGTWATTGGPTTGSATMTAPNTTGDYTFTITCTTVGGQSTFVTAIVAVTGSGSSSVASVSFTDNSIEIQPGNTATLSWTPINAGSCAIANIGSPAGPTGTTTGNSWSAVFPIIYNPGTYTYKVFCIATGGALPTNPEATATVVVTTTAPSVPTVTLTPVSTSVQVGLGTATLTWDGSADVVSCDRAGGSVGWTATNVAADGTFPITAATPVGNYIFSITCKNAAGVTSAPATAVVAVTSTPPVAVASVDLSVSSPSALVGSTPLPTLNWNLQNVGSCTTTSSPAGWTTPLITGANVTGNWSIPTNVATTYTFTINCTPAVGATVGILTDTETITISTMPVASVDFASSVPTSVQAGGTLPLEWTSTNVVANSCDRTGGFGTWVASNGPANSSVAVVAPSTPGSYTFVITCHTVANATPSPTVTDSIMVNVQAAAVASVKFKKTPMVVVVGANLTLEWTSTNVVANSCDRTGGFGTWVASNGPANSSVAVVAPSTPGSYTFVITCHTVANATPSPTVTDLVTVKVESNISIGPVGLTVNITASPMVVDVGQSSIIKWYVIGPAGSTIVCTKSGPKSWKLVPGNNNALVGWKTGTLDSPGTATYTFSCSSGGVTDTKSVTVTWVPPLIPAPPSINITASPMVVDTGKKSMINWSVVGLVTGNCIKEGPKSWKLTPGNNSTFPGWQTGTLDNPGTAEYKLTCTGPGGTRTKSVVVTWVPPLIPAPPNVSLTASLSTVPFNQISTLTWSTTGVATTCTRSAGGSTAWTTAAAGPLAAISGSWNVPTNVAGSTTYSIKCTGPGGTSQIVSKQITVQPYQNPPTVTVTANNVANSISAPQGSVVTIKWSKTYCTDENKSSSPVVPGWAFASGGTFNSPTNGPVGSSITYSVSCTGWPGAVPPSASGSVTVTLTQPVPPPPPVLTASIYASPTSVSEGGTTDITWSSNNAASCTKTGPFWGVNDPALSGSSGSYPLYIDKTFTITCTGITGSAPATITKSVTVTVN